MLTDAITPEMHYDDWAPAYDNDVAGWSYHAPDRVIAPVRSALQESGHPPHILDLGIGTGLVSEKIRDIRPDAHISGIDISTRMLDICRTKNVADRLEKCNAATDPFPFASQSFDFILAAGVMENVGRIGHTIQEMGRVLKPGGMVAFTYVPDDSHPLQSHKSKRMRPGRTASGRFVMGNLDLYGHNPRKIKVFCSGAGIAPAGKESFVGFRSYVFLMIRYDLFIGRKPTG